MLVLFLNPCFIRRLTPTRKPRKIKSSPIIYVSQQLIHFSTSSSPSRPLSSLPHPRLLRLHFLFQEPLLLRNSIWEEKTMSVEMGKRSSSYEGKLPASAMVKIKWLVSLDGNTPYETWPAQFPPQKKMMT
ncbi:hypothetical protein EUGRSUZ_H04215 [Eucalyptus grandis]|uniref:Uncharacterized protein n=2 Tax=Eucalyptus grandis TaxID=71139 RepID=A0ACC3JVZ8_EUCGR|nr:hypothetical protein EUGRSUZ_H04215 [Eucalyptus grandis]